MKLSFFGAAHAVTGSCHCLEVNGRKILIDCGLQQGRDEHDDNALDFAPGQIDYCLVTHAHIDLSLIHISPRPVSGPPRRGRTTPPPAHPNRGPP